MNKIINKTVNGNIFRCSECNKIHIEYKNLNFNFNDTEYMNFANYFLELDGKYWESVNFQTSFRKKIIVPIGHKNVNILLNNTELQELKKLFSKPINSEPKILINFKYEFFNN